MSIRAYRVIEIKTDKNFTFNLSRAEEELSDVLKNAGFYDEDNGSLYQVEVDRLKEELKKCKDLGEDEYARKGLMADIKKAEKNGDDYIQYYCF